MNKLACISFSLLFVFCISEALECYRCQTFTSFKSQFISHSGFKKEEKEDFYKPCNETLSSSHTLVCPPQSDSKDETDVQPVCLYVRVEGRTGGQILRSCGFTDFDCATYKYPQEGTEVKDCYICNDKDLCNDRIYNGS